MILLDKGGAAIEGGAFSEAGDGWQQLLRLGPVVDIDSGKEVIDITPELCAEIAKGHAAAVKHGVRVPVDHNHGTARGTTAEERRTYGTLDTVEVREDGLYGKLLLNAGGKKWVEDNKGNAFLSPDIRAGLFNPEKPKDKLAGYYLRAVSLTEMPRQNRLREVQLSRTDCSHLRPAVLLASFTDDGDARRFLEALARGAQGVLVAEGFAAPEWLHVAAWQGAESGTCVVSWWPETGGHQLRQLAWARAEGGALTVTGPSEPVQAVTVYEPVSPAAPAATLSRGDAPKEVPMPGNETEQPFAALLARLPDADRGAVEKVVREASERAQKAEQDRDALSVQLSAAKAEAEKAGKATETLLSRVERMEKDLADKAKAEADKARSEWLLSATQRGRIGADEADQKLWGELYDSLGADKASRALPAEGTKGPILLGRAPGLDGVGTPLSETERATKISERATAIAADGKVGWNDAWKQAEKEVGR